MFILSYAYTLSRDGMMALLRGISANTIQKCFYNLKVFHKMTYYIVIMFIT